MPKMGSTIEFELQFKDGFTKVEAELQLVVDGRELPNAAIVGEAMEKALVAIQQAVKEGYENVAIRDGATPVATT